MSARPENTSVFAAHAAALGWIGGVALGFVLGWINVEATTDRAAAICFLLRCLVFSFVPGIPGSLEALG